MRRRSDRRRCRAPMAGHRRLPGDRRDNGSDTQSALGRALRVYPTRACSTCGGDLIVADAEHQWLVTVDSQEIVVTTVQILSLLSAGRSVSIQREPAAHAAAI